MNSSSFFSVFVAVLAILGFFWRFLFPYPPITLVGIDLGTSYSSVAIFNAGIGTITVIKDSQNRSLIPSIVNIFKNGSISVGDKPVTQDKFITFYDSKRFIGRSAEVLKNFEGIYPFSLTDNAGIKFVIPDDFKLNVFKSRYVAPEEISSLILLKIKEVLRKSLGYSPNNIVLGVPVEFNQVQRKLTLKAAKLAGFNVLRLVNEPTAASMACGVHKRPEVSYVMVIDLGGGTYDVSLLHSTDGMLTTLSISGNDKLGGRDFTNTFARWIDSRTDNSTFTQNEFRQFYQTVEDTKISLTAHKSASVSFVKNSRKWSFEVDRSNFEEVNLQNFEKLIPPIEVVLAQCKLTASDIDEIVLVGGATKMPRLRESLTYFFNRSPNLEVDPDLAVVIGLANEAAVLGESWPLEVSATDITPKNLEKIEL